MLVQPFRSFAALGLSFKLAETVFAHLGSSINGHAVHCALDRRKCMKMYQMHWNAVLHGKLEPLRYVARQEQSWSQTDFGEFKSFDESSAQRWPWRGGRCSTLWTAAASQLMNIMNHVEFKGHLLHPNQGLNWTLRSVMPFRTNRKAEIAFSLQKLSMQKITEKLMKIGQAACRSSIWERLQWSCEAELQQLCRKCPRARGQLFLKHFEILWTIGDHWYCLHLLGSIRFGFPGGWAAGQRWRTLKRLFAGLSDGWLGPSEPSVVVWGLELSGLTEIHPLGINFLNMSFRL